MFVSLSLGTPLYNVPRSILLENLSYYVVQFGITHLGIVPSLMEATLSVAQEDGDLENMKLRYICSGGEKITDAVRVLVDLGPYVTLNAGLLRF